MWVIQLDEKSFYFTNKNRGSFSSNFNRAKRFKSEPAAKSALTKINKKWNGVWKEAKIYQVSE